MTHIVQVLSVLILFSIYACSGKYDYIIEEKDLIPEGTAFNEKNGQVYIGSIYKQKIVGIHPDGMVDDIITSDQFGALSPLGMEVDAESNVLWVCGAKAPIVKKGKASTKSAILAFNLTTAKRSKKYELEHEPALPNDLTLDKHGNVYITETLQGKVYKIDRRTDSLCVFHELRDQSGPNGIVFYEPLNAIFVSTDQGIVKLPLNTKRAQLLITADGIDATVIDGLSIYDNYFIGHQSTKVSRFYFNTDLSKITKAEVLDTGKAFDSSTTGEVGLDHYYFIVNSQLKSGIDRKKKSLKPLDSLEHIIVRKLKL